jgi:predicted  nucleic acid-binding Zn-ribbon protein
MVRKHEAELNSVKSNDAYKALLKEIADAKQIKDQVETEIIEIMLQIDQANLDLKKFEADIKTIQGHLESQIQQKEGEIKKTEGLLEQEKAKREQFSSGISKDFLSRYDYIRTKKKTFAIAKIEGETCSGCNTSLTQSLINEARKGKELVMCESCSRILYLESGVESSQIRDETKISGS